MNTIERVCVRLCAYAQRIKSTVNFSFRLIHSIGSLLASLLRPANQSLTALLTALLISLHAHGSTPRNYNSSVWQWKRKVHLKGFHGPVFYCRVFWTFLFGCYSDPLAITGKKLSESQGTIQFVCKQRRKDNIWVAAETVFERCLLVFVVPRSRVITCEAATE